MSISICSEVLVDKSLENVPPRFVPLTFGLGMSVPHPERPDLVLPTSSGGKVMKETSIRERCLQSISYFRSTSTTSALCDRLSSASISVRGRLSSISSRAWMQAKAASLWPVRFLCILRRSSKKCRRKSLILVATCAEGVPYTILEDHQCLMPSLEPGSRNHERSILK